jgi:alkylation response protein AidB-like acyl-CoA dehydrogenase
MDFSLSPEHEALRETIRKFLAKELPDRTVRELDENDEFPLEIFRKLIPLGVCALTVEERYGGVGVDIPGAILVVEELSRRFPALGWLYVMNAFYGSVNIGRNGCAAQKERYLPALARGEIVFSYALTESDAGSDAASARTGLTRRGDGFRLNGTKTLITGADRADHLLVLARSDRDVPKHKGLSMVLVDRRAEGVGIRRLRKLGYKGSSLCEVVFEDVEVGPDAVLGGPECLNRGWSQLLGSLDVEHLEIAACSVGVAQGAFDEAMKYAKERQQFGQPIARFQAIQHMFAEMATAILTARLLLQCATWMMAQGKPCVMEAAMAKYHASEVAKQVSLAGLQIFGGYGYTMGYPIQRYVRDSLVLPIGGGTSQILKNVIANRLGLK